MATKKIKNLKDLRRVIGARGLEDALTVTLPDLIEEVAFAPKAETQLRALHTSGLARTLQDLTTAPVTATLRRELGVLGVRALSGSIERRLTQLTAIARAQGRPASNPRDAAKPSIGMSEAALRAWAACHGSADLVDCQMHELPGADELRLYWEDPAVTLLELVTSAPAGRRGAAARMTAEAQQFCLLRLLRRADEHEVMGAQLRHRRETLVRPNDPHLQSYFDTIEAQIATMSSIASTPVRAGDEPFHVGMTEGGDGIRIVLSRPPQLGCDGDPDISLVGRGERACLTCDCEAPRPMCRNRLDALWRMRDVLDTDTYPHLAGLRDELAEAFRLPAGERQARVLLKRLGLRTRQQPTLDGVVSEPVWRLSDKGGDWSVSPGLRRPKKTGQGWVVRGWPRGEAETWYATHASPLDAEIYEVTQALEGASRSHWASMYSYLEVLEKRLLTLLVGHPRVVPAKGGPERIDVVRRTPVLHLDTDGDVATVRVTIAGEPATEHLTDMQCEALVHGTVFNWEAGRAVAEVIERSPEVAAALILEQRRVNRVPAAGIGLLRDELLPLARSGGATLSEAVRGDAVSARTDLVVELAFTAGALRVALRAAPLSDGPLCDPGFGPEVWYALADGDPVHATRDLAGERRAAGALWAALADVAGSTVDFEPEGAALDDDERRWVTTLHDLDAALDVVGWLRLAAEDSPAELGDGAAATEHPWQGLDVRWDTEQLRVTGQATARNLKVALAEGRDWFGVRAELHVDGAVIPLSQLLAAARDAQRYVQVAGGGWVKVEEGLRRRLSAVASASAEGRLSPLAGPGLLALEEEGAEVAGPARWLEMADRIRAAAGSTPEVPEDLQAELRGYQVEGFRWLARLATWAPGAVLADDMGLGKTVQALALLLHRQHEGPSLVIAPTSLGFNWQREATRFAPGLRLRALRGKLDLAALDGLEPGVVVVTSWDVAVLQRERLVAVDWATLVLDEAQAVKNATTRRAKAVHALGASFRLALTGTPLENHTGELWSVLRAAVPGLLGGQKHFRERFQVPIDRHGDPRAKGALAALIAPFVLRRLKREVATELPPRTDVQVDVTLSPAERKRYAALQRSVAAELAAPVDPETQGQARRFRVLAALTRLRQLSCHTGLVDPTFSGHSSKVLELQRRLQSLREEGHQALVFSQFTSLLDRVGPALEEAGLRVLQLDGRTSARKRRQLVDAFQRGEADVFLLSIKAGGTGLNLTAASFVFHLDPWWNPAVEDQATDRAHRIGQRQAVTVYRLIARGTVEEAIYAMHGEKRALMDALMAGAGSAKALSVAELEALITSGGQSGAEALQGDVEPPSSEPLEALAPPVKDAKSVVPAPARPAPRRATEAKVRKVVKQPAPSRSDRRRAAPVALGPDSRRALASLQRCLDEALASGEIARAPTVRGYVVKAERFLGWLERHEVVLTSAAVLAAGDDYRRALEAGEWPAPKSDRVFVSGTARWLAQALADAEA